MDKYNFLDLASLIGIFLVLFLALFLLTVKTKHKLGNQLFSFFLIANAIDACKYLIHHIPENLINLEVFRWSFVYLVPASFYLYAMSVCFYNFRLKTKHLLHTIPFVAYNLFLMSGIYFENTSMKLHFIKNMNQMPINHFFQFLFELQFQVYFIALFLVIRKSRTVYLENYTNPNISVINALYKITIIYYLLHFLVLLRWVVTYTIGVGEFRQWIVTLDGFSFLFCTCWYLFIALNNPEFFR